MPFEIREILFLMPEFHKALMAYGEAGNRAGLPETTNLQLVDAVHMRELGELEWDRKGAFLAVLEQEMPLPGEGVAILTRASGPGAAKQLGFVLDERLVQEVLIEACRREGVMLPKRGRKAVFVRDLMVGLRIHVNDGVFRSIRRAISAK